MLSGPEWASRAYISSGHPCPSSHLCSLFLLVLFDGGHDACVEVTGELWRVGTLLLCEFRGWTVGRLLSDGRTEITELCGWKPVKCEPFTLRFALCGL